MATHSNGMSALQLAAQLGVTYKTAWPGHLLLARVEEDAVADQVEQPRLAAQLQAIFEQADQCLVIDDPLQAVLDRIHDGITMTGTPGYLLSKLPLGVNGAEEDPASVLLKRSFAAYRATQANDTDWIETRMASAIAARARVHLTDQDRWIEQIAGSTGLSIGLLQQLVE